MLWSSLAVAVAATFEVPGDFDDVRSALDEALSGDTIVIGPGVFSERIVIDRDVILRGAGPEQTTLGPGPSGPAVIEVQGYGVSLTLEDLRIDGGKIRHGLVADYVGATVTVRGVDFVGGAELPSALGGADLHALSATVNLHDSTFTDPVTTAGDGAHVKVYGDLLIEGCVFEGGTVEGLDPQVWGGVGGAVAAGEALIVRDSSFTNNTAGGAGGALSVIDRLVVERSTFTSNHASVGGAVQYDGGGRADIVESTFVGNTAWEAGGLNLHNLDQVHVLDSHFEDNSAQIGAAFDLTEVAVAEVIRNTFAENTSETGAIRVTDVDASFAGNLFCDNAGMALMVDSYGVRETHVAMRHEQFVRNGGPDSPGTLVVWGNSQVSLSHSTLYDNEAESGAAVIYVGFGAIDLHNTALVEGRPAGLGLWEYGSLSESYNLWWRNGAHLTGPTAPDALDPTDIQLDPQLVDPDGGCAADLRPTPDSPLIDAGDPALLDADGSRSDIGAFSGAAAAEYVDLDQDGQIVGDCDPLDPSVHIDAPEVAGDSIDQDCDGTDLCYEDSDGDGAGLAEIVGPLGCNADGLSATAGDCNDGNGSIYPGAPDTPGDGIDQDCDGADTPATPGGTITPPVSAEQLPGTWFCQQGSAAPGWLGLLLAGALRRRRRPAPARR